MVDVVVEFEYSSVEEDELSLKPGDRIADVVKMEGGWWEGTLGGKRGVFPDNFVKEVKKEPSSPAKKPGAHVADMASRLGKSGGVKMSPASPPGPQKRTSLSSSSSDSKAVFAKVVYPYTPQHEDELKLTVGDKVKILKQDDEGWWEGSVAGKSGMFPSNFAEITTDWSVEQELDPETANMMKDTNISEGEVREIKGKKIKGIGLGNIFGDAGPTVGKLKNTGSVDKELDSKTDTKSRKGAPPVPRQPPAVPPKEIKEPKLIQDTPPSMSQVGQRGMCFFNITGDSVMMYDNSFDIPPSDTEDSITEDSITEDSITEDSITEECQAATVEPMDVDMDVDMSSLIKISPMEEVKTDDSFKLDAAGFSKVWKEPSEDMPLELSALSQARQTPPPKQSFLRRRKSRGGFRESPSGPLHQSTPQYATTGDHLDTGDHLLYDEIPLTQTTTHHSDSSLNTAEEDGYLNMLKKLVSFTSKDQIISKPRMVDQSCSCTPESLDLHKPLFIKPSLMSRSVGDTGIFPGLFSTLGSTPTKAQHQFSAEKITDSVKLTRNRLSLPGYYSTGLAEDKCIQVCMVVGMELDNPQDVNTPPQIDHPAKSTTAENSVESEPVSTKDTASHNKHVSVLARNLSVLNPRVLLKKMHLKRPGHTKVSDPYEPRPVSHQENYLEYLMKTNRLSPMLQRMLDKYQIYPGGKMHDDYSWYFKTHLVKPTDAEIGHVPSQPATLPEAPPVKPLRRKLPKKSYSEIKTSTKQLFHIKRTPTQLYQPSLSSSEAGLSKVQKKPRRKSSIFHSFRLGRKRHEAQEETIEPTALADSDEKDKSTTGSFVSESHLDQADDNDQDNLDQDNLDQADDMDQNKALTDNLDQHEEYQDHMKDDLEHECKDHNEEYSESNPQQHEQVEEPIIELVQDLTPDEERIESNIIKEVEDEGIAEDVAPFALNYRAVHPDDKKCYQNYIVEHPDEEENVAQPIVELNQVEVIEENPPTAEDPHVIHFEDEYVIVEYDDVVEKQDSPQMLGPNTDKPYSGLVEHPDYERIEDEEKQSTSVQQEGDEESTTVEDILERSAESGQVEPSTSEPSKKPSIRQRLARRMSTLLPSVGHKSEKAMDDSGEEDGEEAPLEAPPADEMEVDAGIQRPKKKRSLFKFGNVKSVSKSEEASGADGEAAEAESVKLSDAQLNEVQPRKKRSFFRSLSPKKSSSQVQPTTEESGPAEAEVQRPKKKRSFFRSISPKKSSSQVADSEANVPKDVNNNDSNPEKPKRKHSFFKGFHSKSKSKAKLVESAPPTTQPPVQDEAPQNLSDIDNELQETLPYSNNNELEAEPVTQKELDTIYRDIQQVPQDLWYAKLQQPSYSEQSSKRCSLATPQTELLHPALPTEYSPKFDPTKMGAGPEEEVIVCDVHLETEDGASYLSEGEIIEERIVPQIKNTSTEESPMLRLECLLPADQDHENFSGNNNYNLFQNRFWDKGNPEAHRRAFNIIWSPDSAFEKSDVDPNLSSCMESSVPYEGLSSTACSLVCNVGDDSCRMDPSNTSFTTASPSAPCYFPEIGTPDSQQPLLTQNEDSANHSCLSAADPSSVSFSTTSPSAQCYFPEIRTPNLQQPLLAQNEDSLLLQDISLNLVDDVGKLIPGLLEDGATAMEDISAASNICVYTSDCDRGFDEVDDSYNQSGDVPDSPEREQIVVTSSVENSPDIEQLLSSSRKKAQDYYCLTQGAISPPVSPESVTDL